MTDITQIAGEMARRKWAKYTAEERKAIMDKVTKARIARQTRHKSITEELEVKSDKDAMESSKCQKCGIQVEEDTMRIIGGQKLCIGCQEV